MVSHGVRATRDTDLLQVTVHILRQLAEEHAEEVRQQRPSQVQALLSEMVSVVQLAAFKSSKQEAVNHVPKEVCLLRLGTLSHRNVREHLLLQNLLRVSQPTFAGETSGDATVANEVERDLQSKRGKFLRPVNAKNETNLTVLDNEAVINTRL
jgi:CRP-like cAMP-binding protein